MKVNKVTLSVRELQKNIGQSKSWKITDSAIAKLLDLYLGVTAYMNEDAVYPVKKLRPQSVAKIQEYTLLVNIVRQRDRLVLS